MLLQHCTVCMSDEGYLASRDSSLDVGMWKSTLFLRRRLRDLLFELLRFGSSPESSLSIETDELTARARRNGERRLTH